MLCVKVLGSIPPEWYAMMVKITFATEGTGFNSNKKVCCDVQNQIYNRRCWVQFHKKIYAVLFKSNLLNTWVQVQQTSTCYEDLQDLQD